MTVVPCVNLGGSRQVVSLRRFRFSTVHLHYKNTRSSFTCALSDQEWTLRTG
jgi:hypothetical protein